MFNIYTGIVTFNPDINLLKQNIDSIINQVREVVIFDNNSSNINEIKELVKKFVNIKMFISERNEGIAYALNRLMQYGKENKYQWMLSLDQDSICPNDYIKNMGSILDSLDNIGILAPTIVDRNTGIIGYKFKEKYKDVKNAITSGSITNISAWKDVNGYDNKMFIDCVDFDFSYRLRKKGYRVVQTSLVELNHSVGEGKKCKFLFFTVNNYEHTAFRCFYMAQNRIYYPKKNKDFLLLIKGNFKNINHLFRIILFEHDKKNKIKALFKGWKNGYKLQS